MDPGEGKDNEEERPFCKVCGEYDDLMVPQVCICTGSVANICSDCLLQTITHRDSDAPTDEYGEPVCPDCHTSYQNISYRWGPNPQTFNQYMVNQTGWSILDPIARSVVYVIIIAFLCAGLFLTPVPEGAWWFPLRLFISVAYLAGIVFFGGGTMILWREMYEVYRQFLERPQRVISHFIRLIAPKESTYIKIPESDEESGGHQLGYPTDSPTFPQVRPPFPIPQPPIEPPIPARPPLMRPIQFRPIELSRRGRRWSTPQQPRQPPRSARQMQTHTPRRNWTQQPRSRHQRRRQ